MRKTKLALLMAGIMILVTFGAFSVNANPLNAYSISGNVFDKNTDKPIRGALIIESWWHYNRQGIAVRSIKLLTSNSDGYFIDSNAPYYTVKLTVLKLGYHRASQTVVYTDGGAEVTFHLKPRWWN
jgi:hypothetical protein